MVFVISGCRPSPGAVASAAPTVLKEVKPPAMEHTTPVNHSAPAEDWICFVADPQTPTFPDGNVTHYKQRFVDGRLETRNVHAHPDRIGSTRINYVRDGDHLQLTWDTGSDIVQLFAADASRWTRHETEHGDWVATEEIAIGSEGMTSTVLGRDLSISRIHFIPAPCSVVDTELAKHPSTTYQSDPVR
jgi:hypothetical protein